MKNTQIKKLGFQRKPHQKYQKKLLKIFQRLKKFISNQI